jgi:phage terminase large subunit-like protein
MQAEPTTGTIAVDDIASMPLHLLGNHPAEEYCRNVLVGETVACRFVKLACLRYLRDLETGAERGLYFDREAAIHRLGFYGYCRHFEGQWAGQVIEPSPWQQFIKWNIYGWMKSDGTRRFRTVYEECARKNGKSTDLATDGIYLAFFDNEPGAQVFTAATKKDQAIIIHRASTRMVKASPSLRRRISIFKNNLNVDTTASKYEPLGEDSKTEDGRNVHAGLLDEYHAHPSGDMYDVLRSGMGARQQPLLYVITTAGFNKFSSCYSEREYAVNVLEGVFEDDSYFAIIFTPDDPEDWTNETQWQMANPNLGVCVSIDDMRDQCRKAKQMPSKQNEFKTKRLNIWTDSQTAWITLAMWQACNAPVDSERLKGRKCFGAFDLSSTKDMTAWVLCFPPLTEEDKFEFLFRLYVPQDDLERLYPQPEVYNWIKTWIRQQYITATPGNVIDYDFIEAQIIEDAKTYDIEQIPYDPYNAAQLVTNLQKEDIELVEFRQGFLTMSPAAKDFETKVMQGLIAHGGNPVIDWMISCTEVATDPAGNIKPVKPDRGKSVKRIDGVVAAIMALSAAVRNTKEPTPSVEVW